MFEENRTYSLRELMQVIKESTNEFQPKVGDHVTGDTKSIKANKDSIKKMEKDVADFNGEIDEKENETLKIGDENLDHNMTTLDMKFGMEPSKSYKERVKAQVHGYPSKDNEEMHKDDDENESEAFEGNKKFYDDVKKRKMERSDDEVELKHSGLAARTFPKERFKSNHAFESKTPKQNTNEIKKMKRLNFKSTVFESKDAMKKLIPDPYKTDGNQFIMMDKEKNEYLVEWVGKGNNGIAEVRDYRNESKINEDFNRIKELMNYDRTADFKPQTAQERISESAGYADRFNRIKGFINEVEKKEKDE